jgi:hypothetical protein
MTAFLRRNMADDGWRNLPFKAGIVDVLPLFLVVNRPQLRNIHPVFCPLRLFASTVTDFALLGDGLIREGVVAQNFSNLS